jgi:hypothetical protein
MGGKRRAQPSGNAQGKAAASQDAVAAQGGASRKRLSVHGAAAGSAGAGSCGQEESGSTLAPVTIFLSMRFDPIALGGRKTALEAALRELMTEFGGRECRVEWTRVGPSEDTLQRVLPLVLSLVEPEGAAKCLFVCKSWQREMESRGFCSKTVQLCSALAEGGDAEQLGQNALRRLNASTEEETNQSAWSNASAFLGKSIGWKGSLHEWLQAASQEPDASFLSRGAASTAQALGLPLIQWVGQPQGRYPGESTLAGHSRAVLSVAFSRDGKRVASGSRDNLVKIWDIETGAEVRLL